MESKTEFSKNAIGLASGQTVMFQKSVDTRTLPQDLLNANISYVFKKGDRHAAENFRLLSLTSVPCKILGTYYMQAHL